MPIWRCTEEPDRDVTGLRLTPHQVGATISVDIANARDLPREIHERHMRERTTRTLKPRHLTVRREHVIVRHAALDDIGDAVTVEVSGHRRIGSPWWTRSGIPPQGPIA